ncbi:uncharacterized protein LOC109803800 isoform X1 [Cajanus cajan]|uniref:uncharacterized protein LOC109803800 isoform X1 n=1 Tax=Cajanus cajan TaxID=3821 RepID=UPI0010FB56D7|nr:uncharacterized protein LOC109803800 isoform X1 [Cajanus cajan]
MGSTLKTSEVMDDGEEDFVVEGGDGGQYKHMKEKKMLLDTYLISFFLMQIAGFLAFLATPRFQDNAKIAGFIASLQLLKLKIMLCARYFSNCFLCLKAATYCSYHFLTLSVLKSSGLTLPMKQVLIAQT